MSGEAAPGKGRPTNARAGEKERVEQRWGNRGSERISLIESHTLDAPLHVAAHRGAWQRPQGLAASKGAPSPGVWSP